MTLSAKRNGRDGDEIKTNATERSRQRQWSYGGAFRGLCDQLWVSTERWSGVHVRDCVSRRYQRSLQQNAEPMKKPSAESVPSIYHLVLTRLHRNTTPALPLLSQSRILSRETPRKTGRRASGIVAAYQRQRCRKRGGS